MFLFTFDFIIATRLMRNDREMTKENEAVGIIVACKRIEALGMAVTRDKVHADTAIFFAKHQQQFPIGLNWQPIRRTRRTTVAMKAEPFAYTPRVAIIATIRSLWIDSWCHRR